MEVKGPIRSTTLNNVTGRSICQDGSGSEEIPRRCEKNSFDDVQARDKKLISIEKILR